MRKKARADCECHRKWSRKLLTKIRKHNSSHRQNHNKPSAIQLKGLRHCKHDQFTGAPLHELTQSIIFLHGHKACAEFETLISTLDHDRKRGAMEWCARGLLPYVAIRKSESMNPWGQEEKKKPEKIESGKELYPDYYFFEPTKNPNTSPSRKGLRRLGHDSRHKFSALFVREGSKNGYKGRKERTLLVHQVTHIETGDVVSDHLWFNYTKGFQSLGSLTEGAVICFHARVETYERGYLGRREEVYKPYSVDYKLSRPTKISLASQAEK